MAAKLKILVTGGAGYLGSIIVPDLLSDGHKVTVLDNFMFGQNSLGHVCHYQDLEIIRGDVREVNIISEIIKDFDLVIPLAALVGAPLCDNNPNGAKTVNFEAVQMLVDNLHTSQIIILPTTNSGYGVGEKNAYCTEESDLNPITLYGRTKVDAEKSVLNRENSVSLRLATVFGMAPRMRLDLLVNDFVYRAVTDRTVVLFESHFKRNYVHIRDVSRAFKHVIKEFDKLRGNAFNVGLSDANLSKTELCERIKFQIPNFVFIDAPIGSDPDKRDYIISNEKFENTGYTTKFSLDDGIRELVTGYQMIRNTRYGNL